jgi:hypothetical protein
MAVQDGEESGETGYVGRIAGGRKGIKNQQVKGGKRV